MNAMQRLNDLILQKNSRICARLDPTWEGIPKEFKRKVAREVGGSSRLNDGELKFFWLNTILLKYCKTYVDAICDIVPAIKMNSAFFERWHLEDSYLEIAKYAKTKGLFVIADLNRTDSGCAATACAEAYLGKHSPFSAITINPYLGTEGIMPFLKVAKENGKGVFIMVKTPNTSASEVQNLELKDGRKLYEAVADLVIKWQEEIDPENYFERFPDEYSIVGAQVGVTNQKEAKRLAGKMGLTFLLVTSYERAGVTADDVSCSFDYNGGVGAIVDSSTNIMYAYKKDCWKEKYCEETWAEAAKAEAIRLTEELNDAIDSFVGRKVCIKIV